MITTAILQDITHGFGTKDDGDGRDPDTLRTILQKSIIKYSAIISPHQLHGTHVEVVSEESAEHPVADALVTASSGIVLSVLSADCVPIIYSDPVRKIIGISHGGWKGTLEMIPQKVVETMKSLGSQAQDIRVAIGPSIGPCCYDVYGSRLTSFRETFKSSVIVNHNDRSYLDLQCANRETLISLGILEDHIDTIELCTSCNSTQFFSYKRDGAIKGEMVSFITSKYRSDI